MRVCTICGRLMKEGYVHEQALEYACSDVCLYSDVTEKEYEEYCDDDVSYWTEWEDEDEVCEDDLIPSKLYQLNQPLQKTTLAQLSGLRDMYIAFIGDSPTIIQKAILEEMTRILNLLKNNEVNPERELTMSPESWALFEYC